MNPTLDKIIVYGFLLAALAVFCRWIWLRFFRVEQPVAEPKKKSLLQRVIVVLVGILAAVRCLQLLGSVMELADSATRPPHPVMSKNSI